MARRILNKTGTNLLEVTAVLLIIGVILSMLVANFVNRINIAKYEKTVNELTAIAQASIDYFNMMGSCPPGISQLAPEFMPHSVTSSPFGTTYLPPSCSNSMVTVSVLIPSGIAPESPQGQLGEIIHQGKQDQIEISQLVQNEFTSRLGYCLNFSC